MINRTRFVCSTLSYIIFAICISLISIYSAVTGNNVVLILSALAAIAVSTGKVELK